MPQAAVPALVGATLISGHQQSKAAKSAAKSQQQAADQAAQVQREALQQFRLASEPFRFGGQQAINPLLQSLGISPIQMPQNPVFNMMTGQPIQQSFDRRAEIEARLAELRALRGNQ